MKIKLGNFEVEIDDSLVPMVIGIPCITIVVIVGVIFEVIK